MVVCVRVRPRFQTSFSVSHFTPFAPWNHDILNFLSQTWSRGGRRLPCDNFCLQPKRSLPWTRVPSRKETKVVISRLSLDVIWILLNHSQSRSFAYRVTSHQFKVDYAFSADDSNDTVYDAVARPCIDLALRVRYPLHYTFCLSFFGEDRSILGAHFVQGGVSSFLAYGQTGSGKTFTINGILERLAANIIKTKGSEIKIHLGFMEMLGNASTDLLNPGVKVQGGFFYWSARFSVPKWKTSCS